MSYVLGIDGGGSKTVCVLMDKAQQVLGRGEAGSSNYQSIGIAAAFQSIESAIYAAVMAFIDLVSYTRKGTALPCPYTSRYDILPQNNTNYLEIQGICLGLAGVGRPADIKVVKNLVQELQNSQFLPIIWQLQPANIVICHDALIALVGGIGHPVGIVAAAGTGSIVFGRNHQGETRRVGGWGYILGDEGSAYKIAVAGMQAALKSYDGREMSTSLIDGFKQHLDLASIQDLIEVIYRRGWGVKEIAALAPIVDLAAASGDEVANQIIDDAVQELVKATATVIEAIFSDESVVEVVTTGSVWRGRCKMQERFAASVGMNYSRVQVIFPRYEPAIGAGLLALRRLAGEEI